MTEDTINVFIKLREHATNKRDEQIAWGAVDLIDAQLSKVPPGQDNRIDLLLGRRCAVLPADEALRVAAAQARITAERLTPRLSPDAVDMIAGWLTPKQIAQLDNREMVHIAADAMQNQKPIEY